MKHIRNSALWWMAGTMGLAMIALMGSSTAWAQGEKRSVFTERDFHWQGHLKAGQTLEVINRNGEIEASAASGDEVRAGGAWKGEGDGSEAFVEVVEYPDGVTICAVYARDKAPGRCHRGGVSSESTGGWWHGTHARINFDVQVPRGVRFNAMTTNGNVVGHALASVVEAATTNGNVDVSTSEWASASTTNGGIHVSIGNAKWSGELKVRSTNGSVDVTLPASAEFTLDAATTNGGINTDFPITVQGSFNSKRLSGTVGAGGRELKVGTTNGGIKLMKS
jgi:Putative adhesin